LSRVLPAIFVLWLVGALTTLARIARSQVALRHIKKHARTAPLAEWDCGDVLNGRNVKIGLRADIRSAVLAGVLRAMILLPDDVANWTKPAEQRAMIALELAHVERRDPLVNLFQTALRVVFYFHPMVRFASRQLGLERELACDDRVVSFGAEPQIVAAHWRSNKKRQAAGNRRPAFFC
jgi:beta-lactamase regulating signal transducer with metallopeptidase domain